MELAILALLEQHGSLAYEQVTAHLGEPPNAVRSALQAMRERVWVPSTPSKTCHPSLARGRCLYRALRAINLVGAFVFARVHLGVRVCIYEFHARANTRLRRIWQGWIGSLRVPSGGLRGRLARRRVRIRAATRQAGRDADVIEL
jgi:hypothetical protein